MLYFSLFMIGIILLRMCLSHDSFADHAWLMHFDCTYSISTRVFIFPPTEVSMIPPLPLFLFSERRTAVQAKKPFHLH